MTDQYPDGDLEAMYHRVPTGRGGEARECVDAMLFLASNAASYITGVVLPVDGGAHELAAARPGSVPSRAMPTEVRVERDGGVAVVTLAAPERRNALTVAMAAELGDACNALDADPTVGAVVVAAEGRTFCAGGDRATLADAGRDPAHPDRYAALTAIYRAFTRVGELEAPTVAAVAGHAVGAGLNLALATDLRVVAEDAVLTSGFIPIGLHPGGGHTALLHRTGSREAAAALALFGERLDGRRAVELGLAWRAVATEQVLDTALGLARVPAADPELARRTARSFRLAAGPPALPWPAVLEAERSAQMWSMRRSAPDPA